MPNVRSASVPHDCLVANARQLIEGAAMGRIQVRLTPRAKADAIEGWRDGQLRARVSAPPIDGRANEALVRLLADALGVPKSAIAIVTGATSRQKTLEVAGLDDDAIRARLGPG